jgi:hypothetical protein
MGEEGLECFGSPADAFYYVDDNLFHHRVTTLYNGAQFAWLKWWSGDTEVGYIFADGTVDIVAVVSDGDIYECTVMAPAR